MQCTILRGPSPLPLLFRVYPFPVIRRDLPDQVLGHQLPQQLGDAREVGLVLLELDPVDECAQLQHLLPGALVVASEIFGQLLSETEQVSPPPYMWASATSASADPA